ncbi:MAG TPA: tetratricopeptide repeat protein [Candidatus Acidoferrum sp.]|nr:tetratricopeptide repeat protein [Candidatus Acidoferrum sp.]
MFSVRSALNTALPSAGTPERGRVSLLSLLLFGLVWGAFFPALRGDFIEFDDFAYVTSNPCLSLTPANAMRVVTQGVAANWHPLTQWSLMLDHSLGGLNPWGFHFTNVLLHALNSILVFLVLHRLTGTLWRSFVVAALFGLHPLRVESVAWISERKDVLCGLFWLLALWAYARFAQAMSGSRSQATRLFFASSSSYWQALGFFALGLMSKPMVVTLPCVLLLLDFWPLERWRRERWADLAVEKIPFFFLSALGCIITFLVQRSGGMMQELAGLPLSFDLRLENALVAYARYLGKLFWPVNLCALYPHPGHWPPADVLLAGLLVLALSALALGLRRHRPYWLTGWFWFLGTFVPVIGLIQVGAQALADRYTYIPSLGILILGVWEFHRLTKNRSRQAIWGGITGGVLVLACLLLTRHQLIFWHDGVSLWRRAVAMTQNNYDAHNRLGRALYLQQHFDAAARELEAATQLNPSFAEPWCSLGQAYAAQGRMDDAIAVCQKALDLRPAFVAAHNNLSDFLLRAGRPDEALVHCLRAVEIEPDSVTAQNNLGNALALKGRLAEAVSHFQKALAVQPGNPMVQANLASALLRLGRFDEAIQLFHQALAAQPDKAETHNNLGGALLSKGQTGEAVQEFRAAAKLEPWRFEAHRNLGNALLKLGALDEAILEFQEAFRLQPSSAVVSNDLAAALSLKANRAVHPPPAPPP